MLRPGPRNLITDVPGILVGNATLPDLLTGVSVVVAEPAAVAGVDCRGGAPGTRETDLLDPACAVERVDAICLAGGSAFGLAAADGVLRQLAAAGRGHPVAGWRVPIVPAAIIFDLLTGAKAPGRLPDYAALGAAAAAAADAGGFGLGNVGAGAGARAGRLKGGLGSASAVDDDGLQIGALVAVNARGSVTLGAQPQFLAWPWEQGAEFGGLPPPTERVPLGPAGQAQPRLGENTTIAVVATNAALGKAEAQRVAIMAQDGLARAIRPLHTPFDGDSVFALSTQRLQVAGDRAALTDRIGMLAADCLARAVARGVYLAHGLPGMQPSWRDRFGQPSSL